MSPDETVDSGGESESRSFFGLGLYTEAADSVDTSSSHVGGKPLKSLKVEIPQTMREQTGDVASSISSDIGAWKADFPVSKFFKLERCRAPREFLASGFWGLLVIEGRR